VVVGAAELDVVVEQRLGHCPEGSGGQTQGQQRGVVVVATWSLGPGEASSCAVAAKAAADLVDGLNREVEKGRR